MTRPPVSRTSLEVAAEKIAAQMDKYLIDKGRGALLSHHEMYGVLAEEMAELLEAVRNNDSNQMIHELIDIAVGAQFALASRLELLP